MKIKKIKKIKNKKGGYISPIDEVCFSVRNPAELMPKESPHKVHFSSFEAAQRCIDDYLVEHQKEGATIEFSPVKTEIDGVSKFLWGVYIIKNEGWGDFGDSF